MSVTGRLRRLFVFDPPDPIRFWRGRAEDSGTLSVMWRNATYNELAARDQWRAIERNLPERRGAVLDLGCGTGRLSPRLAGLFDRYVGVDLDTMIDEAKRRNPNLRAEWVVTRVQEYAFLRDRFDLVLSMACLGNACRAEEIPHMARGMVAATRSGGQIVLIDAFHKVPALTRVCRISSQDVIDVFRGEGVELSEWSGLHFIPVRLLLARESFEGWNATIRIAYAAGEAAMRIAPRWLSDYKVLAFRKP